MTKRKPNSGIEKKVAAKGKAGRSEDSKRDMRTEPPESNEGKRARLPNGYVLIHARLSGGLVVQLLLRVHTDAEGSTLYLGNIPRSWDDEMITTVAEMRGGVSLAELTRDREAGSAHIRLSPPKQASAVVSSWGQNVASVEIPRMRAILDWDAHASAHRHSLTTAFKKRSADIDAFMRRYDAEQATKQAAEKAAHNVPDADGFIKVSKGRATTDGTVTVGPALAASDALKRPEDYILSDFYRFQKRARQQSAITLMREKFEEDKRRVAELRKRRRFM